MADELGICTRCQRYGLLMAPHWVCVLCRLRGPAKCGRCGLVISGTGCGPGYGCPNYRNKVRVV